MEKNITHFIETLREHYERRGGLHHAYLLDRSTARTRGELFTFFESDLGMATSGNPDIWSASFESFGIDDARELGERASRSPLGDRKIFIIEMQFITVQAQNALLKVLEDPVKDTHFFFLMPSASADILLPTVLSRLMRIGGAGCAEQVVDDRVRSFLAYDRAKRIAFLKTAPEILEDKKAAVTFINSLEELVYSKARGAAVPSEIAQSLEEIELCRGYMYDTSGSMKILLEHLALVLPVFE
ncbi:MAG: hypothetical protein G01um101448_681 [Parcubacteria group bacterium Gr01-1014_48]|nr:MAG: hypothetical protein G01um101448_681 [Parcubacteria group bacterium Gr01-1014_48]